MNGNTLPDHMDLLNLVLVTPHPIYVIINGSPTTTTTTTTTTTATESPDRHIWRDLDGYSWIMYDLELMPRSYLRQNDREDFEVIFRTRRPDGLIWFTGDERNNMYLAMKVGHVSCSDLACLPKYNDSGSISCHQDIWLLCMFDITLRWSHTFKSFLKLIVIRAGMFISALIIQSVLMYFFFSFSFLFLSM